MIVMHLALPPFVCFLSPSAQFWSFQINMDMELGYVMVGTFAEFHAWLATRSWVSGLVSLPASASGTDTMRMWQLVV